MAQRQHLGEFEQIVLVVLARLGGESYGPPIRREIERSNGRSVAVGTIYATLARLEAKGVVQSWIGDPTPERGGRRKHYFRLTPSGFAVLNRTYQVWRGWDEPHVALVNEALARQALPEANALGRRVRTDKDAPWLEVIGIVGDVRQKGIGEPPKPEIYESFASMPMPFLTVVARTDRDAAGMLDVIRDVVRRRDPGLAVANLQTLTNYVAAHTSDRRFALVLLAMFGALALVLGGVGVYGVLSYSVAERQREIAIRLALGAAPSGVRSMVVGNALRVVAVGTMAGLGAAVGTGRLMKGLLFGVGSIDPLIFLAVPAGLAVVALAASWIPARRAARVDACGTLRGD